MTSTIGRGTQPIPGNGRHTAAVETDLRRLGRPSAAKVPLIGLGFWVIKVITTGVGESASDALSSQNRLLAASVGFLGFVIALALQLRSRRFVPVLYWLAVLMVAVFGTMAADGIHVVLGVPYVVSTAFWLLILTTIFTLWQYLEGTVSIHDVNTGRREVLYWGTVLATFALGTAAGDLTAIALGLGFRDSILVFAGLILLPALAWWRLGLDPVIAFWTAYVLTRPLGASIADWLGKPAALGHGLGLGDPLVTATGLAAFAILVTWTSLRNRRDAAPGAGAPGPGADLAPTDRALG